MGLGTELKAVGSELKSVFSPRPSKREEENIRVRRDNAALRAKFPSREHKHSSRKRHKTKRMNWKDLDSSIPTHGPHNNAQDPTDSQSNRDDYPSSSAQSLGGLAEQGQGSWLMHENGLVDSITDGSPGSLTSQGKHNTDPTSSGSQNVAFHQANRGSRLGEAGFGLASGATGYALLNPGPVLPDKPKSGGGKLSKGGDEASEGKARDRIYKQLHQLEKEYASINFQEKLSKTPSLVQIDMALKIVIEKYTELSRTAYDMKTNHAGQIRAMTDKMEKADKENVRQIGQLEGKAEEREKRLQEQLEKQRSEKETLVKNYNVQIQKLESEVTSLNDKHIKDSRSMKQQYEQQLGGMKTQLDQQKSTSDANISALRAQIDAANGQWKTYYDGLEAKLRKELSDQGRQMENEYQSKKKAMDEAILRANNERDQVLSKRDRDIEAVRAEWKAEVTQLKAGHEIDKVTATRALQETVEELKTALVERDHFKAMSDHEVANRFQEINSYVDDFARAAYPWDESKQSSWPFQSRALQNSGNERRTKQHIMQNTLWVILFEMIFRTPFCVFGNEGRSLEGQWIEKHGGDLRFSGVRCPRPTKESEKWRYEIMKTCVEAVSQPLRSGDPNYRIKQGYELTLKEASEEMFQELAKVTSVESADMQRLDELVKKAAKLWLEVGQQRCRMFLLMSESGQEKPMRSGPRALNRNRSMNLVVTPELRRLGNSKGERLEKEELVMDCKGKFSAFQSS